MKMISRERLPEHPEQFYTATTGPEGPVICETGPTPVQPVADGSRHPSSGVGQGR
jgi:hypothetical protein